MITLFLISISLAVIMDDFVHTGAMDQTCYDNYVEECEDYYCEHQYIMGEYVEDDVCVQDCADSAVKTCTAPEVLYQKANKCDHRNGYQFISHPDVCTEAAYHFGATEPAYLSGTVPGYQMDGGCYLVYGRGMFVTYPEVNVNENSLASRPRLCKWQPKTCMDGIWNMGEEEVDCGGPCMPCGYTFNVNYNRYNMQNSESKVGSGKMQSRHARLDSPEESAKSMAQSSILETPSANFLLNGFAMIGMLVPFYMVYSFLRNQKQYDQIVDVQV